MSVDLSGIASAITELKRVASVVIPDQQNTFLDMEYQDPVNLKDWNDKLIQTERQFIVPNLLAHQGRPWYQNVLNAPSLLDGVTPEIFPALAQAIRENNAADANVYAQQVANTISAVTQQLGSSRDYLDITQTWAMLLTLGIAAVVFIFVGVLNHYCKKHPFSFKFPFSFRRLN